MKMSMKKSEDFFENLHAIDTNEKNTYLPDGNFYTLWKYLNSERLTGGKTLNFENLTPINGQEYMSATILTQTINKLGGELINLNFNKDLYLKFSPKAYDAALKLINDKNKGLQPKKVEDVLSGKIDFGNILINATYANLQMMEWFEFSTKVHKKIENKLGRFIDDYIDNFIEDKLIDYEKNYYKFEKQKQITFNKLRPYIEKYGNRFLFEYGKDTDEANLYGLDAHYLFIHSLSALERLKYLNIDKLWIFEMMTPPNEQTENYKIRMSINQKLIEEISPEQNKKLEEAQSKKDTLRFDPLNGLFEYNGKTYHITSKTRLALIKKLWQEQKTIDDRGGKIAKKGFPFPKEDLLRNLDIDSLGKNELLREIKELNRIFRKKGFPARIEIKGGVLLIVKI